ncbi:MAG: hypothetical protein KDD55_13100, partial [Bdellovibrionales bacterium]|nr:hypothetical protein [Bdellovibrionales bacterium]
MTIAVHPEFKQSTRGDLLASAERVIPLRLHPYQAFSDFAITWRDVGNQGAELTPTGALRDFAAMQAARTSFRAREMTTKDVVEHLQGPGLEVANLGVSAVITCEPFGPGRGRYLGVVSQRRADFLPAGNRLGTSNVPKTNKLLSGYVNWFDLVRAEGHSLTGSALSRALLSELEEGEVLPWQRLEEEGVQLGQILQGVVRDVLPRSIGRELVIEDRNTLLTQGACTFVPGRDHSGSFARIGDHFSGLFDVHPDKTYSIGPTAPSSRVALPGIGQWSPVVIDGMPYDVGLNYY